MRKKQRLSIFIILAFLLIIFGNCNRSKQKNYIEHNGKKFFLNGVNIAWINFAADVGPGVTDFDGFNEIFTKGRSYGANCMRLWLHTNGTVTPEFDGYIVTGPGEETIDDIQKILDLAYKENLGLILCLWSFDMLRKENGDLVNARNKGILTVDTLMESYIQNSLIPMVDSLKNHPGIIAWEIFNEPEGMCHDITFGGWDFNEHISIYNVQRFINKCAAAIHKTDSRLKVTNGAWSLISATDVDGFYNYYTDERLIEAGGEPTGTLDFYTLHHYDWLHVSPFQKPYEYWQWDKPVVLAEFFPQCKNCGEFSNYENLYKNGYAGALGWDWRGDSSKVIRKEIQHIYKNYPKAITKH